MDGVRGLLLPVVLLGADHLTEDNPDLAVQLVVVDDASTDATADVLVELFAVLLALPLWVRAQPLPIFDAHLHYSHDAWESVPVQDAIAIMRKAGLKRALISSSGDDGQQLASVSGERHVERCLVRSAEDRGNTKRPRVHYLLDCPSGDIALTVPASDRLIGNDGGVKWAPSPLRRRSR